MGERFVWKILNFSCLEGYQVKIQDQNYPPGIVMVIDLFAPSECIGIELICFENRYKNFSIALLDSEGSPLLWREKKNVGTCETSHFFYIKKHTIFGSMKGTFLPNDTLRIQCIAWNTQEQLLAPGSSFFYCSGTELHSEKIEKTFRWHIANINSLETKKQVELFTGDTQLSTSGGDVLAIRLFLDTSLSVKLSTPLDGAQVNCVISVVDVKGKIIQFADEKCHFPKKNKVWAFDTSITKDMLIHYQNSLIPNGTLALSFAFTISANNVNYDRFVSENEIFVKNSRPNTALPLRPETSTSSGEPENKPLHLSSDTIVRTLMYILEEGFMSDFKFRVQGKTFPVHKSILGARSSVFRALFTADMAEKESGHVDVPDVEADTFHRMLQFVYSDSVQEGMQWEGASKLYSAADKYALEPLKQKCSGLLKSEMSVSSVLDVLLLGDAHQDDNLKASALDFIGENDKEIIASKRWKKFAEDNVLLAFEALQKLYEKKMQV